MVEEKTDLIRQYLSKVRTANKEPTKREAFKDLLNRLYGADRDILDVIDRMSLAALGRAAHEKTAHEDKNYILLKMGGTP